MLAKLFTSPFLLAQCEELVQTALQDSAVVVAECAEHTLLMVVAQWSLSLGWLQDRLFSRLLTALSTLLKVNTNTTTSVSAGWSNPPCNTL
jgi:hypothetical protein